MGSTSIGRGEYVWSADGGSPESSSATSAQHASNIIALMKNRQRFDYLWENATERGNQTGMVQSSRGYQRSPRPRWTRCRSRSG